MILLFMIVVLYGMGAATISLLRDASKTEAQAESWSKNLKNPLICTMYGFPAIALLPFLIFDRLVNQPPTGYYDGREL